MLEHVRGQIFRWALVITADADDADDITQQVSLTLYRKLHTFAERSAFSTWLYRIVRNAAIESRKRVRFTREVPFDADEVESALSAGTDDRLSEIHDAESAALIRSMFAELPPRQRELIDLVDAQGFKTVEAAEMMDIEPETARVHLLRARRTLRARMLAQHPERFKS
jgi:RNA polymerase sigma-70 factor, ECF subfamily